jgi:hypothetical protein
VPQVSAPQVSLPQVSPAPATAPAAVVTAPPPAPAAEPADVKGAWTATALVRGLTLDQVLDLVSGRLSGPDGHLEGQIEGNRLVATWSLSDANGLPSCPDRRLGTTVWGTIDARPEDGQLVGQWGSCGAAPAQPFAASRGQPPAQVAAPAPQITAPQTLAPQTSVPAVTVPQVVAPAPEVTVPQVAAPAVQPQPSSPPPAPAPVPVPATPVAATGGYVEPLCKHSDGVFNKPIEAWYGYSCFYKPARKVSISPDNVEQITCEDVSVHTPKSLRAISKCRTPFETVTPITVPQGTVECHEALFAKDGKLSECRREYQQPLLNATIDGRALRCDYMKFDAAGQLTHCGGGFQDGDQHINMAFPTAHGTEAVCNSRNGAFFEAGRFKHCMLAEDWTGDVGPLSVTCFAGAKFEVDGAGQVGERQLNGCNWHRRSAFGPVEAGGMRAHPVPGDTGKHAHCPKKHRGHESCRLNGPRWVAMGPDGTRQLYCDGSGIKVDRGTGYLTGCGTKDPRVFTQIGGDMACWSFALTTAGIVTRCDGRKQDTPLLASFTTPAGPVTCDYRRDDLEFRDDGSFQKCKLNGPAVLTIQRGKPETVTCSGKLRLQENGALAYCDSSEVSQIAFGRQTLPCTGQLSFTDSGALKTCTLASPAAIPVANTTATCEKRVDIWSDGSLRKCSITEPVTLAGPFGGTVTCKPKNLVVAPDGRALICDFVGDAQAPVTLPNGQTVACFGGVFMHIDEDRDTRTFRGAEFGGCDTLAEPQTETIQGAPVSCLGVA